MVTQHGTQIQHAYEAAKMHAVRSKGITVKQPSGYRPQQQDLPALPAELTSELLHCLSTLPDPWPMAKVTLLHGQCKSMGFENGKTFLCRRVRSTRGGNTEYQKSALTTKSPAGGQERAKLILKLALSNFLLNG
jgi:hypothetical protein